METVIHPIPPVFDDESRILILGSFPSVRSREEMFFYGHPQNRFWKTLAAVFEDEIPLTVEEKRTFLHRHRIALWDVIKSCEIAGSSDSSIKNVVPNDISRILSSCQIERIYTNGRMADLYYRKFVYPIIKRETICLPSTSPANARMTLKELIQSWRIVR